MKKKIILNVLVVVLTISVIFEFYIYFNNSKNSKVLEDIKTIDVFKEKDRSLAIMIQNEEFGWDEAEDRSSWPDKTKYTYVGTECTDSEGVKIPTTSVLTFDETTYTAHIKTKQTIYCTLYFAKGRPALEVLKQHKTGGSSTTTFNESDIDGMYRYKGTKDQVINNYICFGTTNTDTCTGNQATYMYRIIGITDKANATLGLEEGQLKIIRAIPSSTSQQWHSSSSSDTKWDAASVQTYLNGTFLNTIDETWKKLIDDPYWWIGDNTNSGATTETTTTKSSAKHKVGLMYKSDYVNAGTQATTNWLHITNGTSSSSTYSSLNEWTMTR